MSAVDARKAFRSTGRSRPPFVLAWRKKGRFILLLAISLLVLIGAPVAQAIEVANLNDSGTGSLRDAIANSSEDISFNASLAGGTIILSSQINIVRDVTIDGSGAAGLTISGNSSVRVFTVGTGYTVTIKDLTISNGRAATGNGGGIKNFGTLTLENCTISNNSSHQNGGGIYNDSTGVLTLQGTTVTGNETDDGTDPSTDPGGGEGAGIYNGGEAYIEGSMITNNICGNGAGALAGPPGVPGVPGGSGGGIWSNGTLSVSNSTIRDNQAGQGGAAAGSESAGPGGNGGGICADNMAGALNISSSTISGNSAGKGGAGSVGAMGGSGGHGGGMHIQNPSAALSITTSTIWGNSAGLGGDDGGYGAGSGGYGGGINFNNYTSSNTYEMKASTIGQNAADYGGGIKTDNQGQGGTLLLSQTVISDNPAWNQGPDVFNHRSDEVTDNGDNWVGIVDSNVLFTPDYSGFPGFEGVLADNGGPTQTMALQSSSGLIDKVSSPTSYDQRGVRRPQPSGGAGDIGAFEMPRDLNVTVEVEGTGDGVVTSDPMAINCDKTTSPCSASFLGGNEVTLTATDDGHSTFTGFSGGGCSESPCTFALDQPYTVTANFSADEYPLTVTVDDPTGTAAVNSSPLSSIDGCTGVCSDYFAVSSIVELTAVPGDAVFVGWSGDCTGSNNPLQITMDSAKSCTATFEGDSVLISGYVTDASSQGISGVVMDGLPTTPSTDTSGFYEDLVPYQWSGTVTPQKSGYTFTPASKTYTEVLSDQIDQNYQGTAATTYTITPSAGTGGSISPSTPQTVAEGGSATFTITPDTGYEILDVVVDGSSVGAVSSYSFTNVTADHTIEAQFTQNAYTITPSAGTGGSISPSTPQTVAEGGSVTFTISPSAGYNIDDVLVDGSSVGAVSSYSFTNVTADHTIEAQFTTQPTPVTHTVTFTAGSGGSIDGATTQIIDDGGDTSPVTAIPDTGQHFAGWTGDHTGMDNPLIITNVTADMTVTANFDALPVADAGPDQTTQEGKTVTLGPTGTPARTGPITQRQWSQLSGPSVVLSDQTAQNPTFVAPNLTSGSVLLTFQLTVEDDFGNSDTDSCQIIVDDNGISGFPPDVTTTRSPTGKAMGIKTGGGQLTKFQPMADDSVPAGKNKPGDMPYGIIDIQVNLVQPGDSAVVTIYFEDPAPTGYQLFKTDGNGGWFLVTHQAAFSTDRTQATLTIADGGPLDADGQVNGVVTDPAGLGRMPALSVSKTFPPGDQAEDYQIMALPLQTNETSPTALLDPQIGTYDETEMRIGLWNVDDQAYEEYPFGPEHEAHPGAAAWFLFRNGQQLDFDGRQTVTVQGPKRDLIGHPVGIGPNWNMVGNPFNYSISLNDVWVVDDGGQLAPLLDPAANTITDPVFWVWQNGQYVAATTLPPFGGGWINKVSGGGGEVFFQGIEATAAATRSGYGYDTSGYAQPPLPIGVSASDTEGGSGTSGGGGGGGGCFIDALGFGPRK